MTTGFFYVNIDLRHRYGISLVESQTFLPRETSPAGEERGEAAVFAGWECTRGTWNGGRRRRATGSILAFFPLMCACVLKISPFALAFLVKFSVHIAMSCFLFFPQSTLIFNLFDVSPNLWYSQCLPCRHVAIIDTPKMQVAATEVWLK